MIKFAYIAIVAVLLLGCKERKEYQLGTLTIVYTNISLREHFNDKYKKHIKGLSKHELEEWSQYEFGYSYEQFKDTYLTVNDSLATRSWITLKRMMFMADSLNKHLPGKAMVKELWIVMGADDYFYGASYVDDIIAMPAGYMYYYNFDTVQDVLYHEFGHAFFWAMPYHDLIASYNVYMEIQEGHTRVFDLFTDSHYGSEMAFGDPAHHAGELFASAFMLVHLHRAELEGKALDLTQEEYLLAEQVIQLIMLNAARYETQSFLNEGLP